jgi:hypothetical protein
MLHKKLINNLPSIPKYIIFIFIVCLIFFGYQSIPHTSLLIRIDYTSNISSSHSTPLIGSGFLHNMTSPTRTLVVYVYGKTHGLAEENLAFFIRTAVHHSHDADYYFILQQINNITFNETKLPLLPSNAHYIQHENKCYDIGTIGWFLSRDIIDRTKYKYFIFLNSSIRGPFIVSYYENIIWYTIFTRRLNDHIKLVGSTINCEVFPHVQSYFWALDVKGLNLLLNNSSVFACHSNMMDTIYNGEIGASQIILNSGFGIDSLMKKYQNMDFGLASNRNCNNGTNPTFVGVDGISLDPFEVVFVKIKDQSVYQDNRKRVDAYEKWMD